MCLDAAAAAQQLPSSAQFSCIQADQCFQTHLRMVSCCRRRRGSRRCRRRRRRHPKSRPSRSSRSCPSTSASWPRCARISWCICTSAFELPIAVSFHCLAQDPCTAGTDSPLAMLTFADGAGAPLNLPTDDRHPGVMTPQGSLLLTRGIAAALLLWRQRMGAAGGRRSQLRVSSHADAVQRQSCVASDCPISCREVSLASGSRCHPVFQSSLGPFAASMHEGCGVGRGRLRWRICAWMLMMLLMQAVTQACPVPQQSAMMSMFLASCTCFCGVH
jgi:hypothetical protein